MDKIFETSGKLTFFYSSISTSGIAQTASAIASAINEVIESHGAEKFCCLITDNTSVMKAAWKMVKNRFPYISAYGCAAHMMNLLVKDTADMTENVKTIKDAEKIIKFFHHLIKVKLD